MSISTLGKKKLKLPIEKNYNWTKHHEFQSWETFNVQ